jgi:hypothetical protein
MKTSAGAAESLTALPNFEWKARQTKAGPQLRGPALQE